MTAPPAPPSARPAAARFEALWNAHHADVLAFVLRRTGDPDLAADVVADTFLVAWRRRGELPADARPWLFGIARKTLANSRRSTRRRDALTARIRHATGSPIAPAVEDDGPRAALRDAFNALSPADRETLALVVWEELTPREAADVLGIPAARFSVRLHRAKQRLRRELARRSDGSSRSAPAPRPAADPMEDPS